MRILAINCGSSSIKCAVIAGEPASRAFELHIESHGSAGDAFFAQLRSRWSELGEIDAVVHRVVHGGDRFTAPMLIDDATLAELATLNDLAPLHNPPAIETIHAARALLGGIPHVAVFDTAFHVTLPPHVREYALPADVRARFRLRRYGFHGISHADVAKRVAAQMGRKPEGLRILSCHLGNGASITAIESGRSVETSMGMTPLEGLVMGTRPGDLDPGIVLALARDLTTAELDELLNRNSGLAGLCGTPDLREVEKRAGEGDESCRLALDIYTHRIEKYLGAYAAVLGGVDAIAFTGGVGEGSSLVRQRSLRHLNFLGAVPDEERNRRAHVSPRQSVIDVATDESRVRILVLRADEEGAMAAAARELLALPRSAAPRHRIPIAVSARHAHLSQPMVDRLFGAGHQLRPRTPLSQPGQFAARETVRLIGPRGRIDDVRVLGPPRERDQIEISRSDEITLGIDAPIRMSGDLAETPGIVIEGPEGRVTLDRGVICAKRHIHASPFDARRLGVADGEVVAVRIDSDGRDLQFADVSVRVGPQFRLELHLDTDEANAAQVKTGDSAELIPPDR